MFKFIYKQTIRERIQAKCTRHPRYNPERDGRNGIKGGCSTCWELYELLNSRLRLDAVVREFTRRAGLWARQHERHRSKPATASNPEETASGETSEEHPKLYLA